jgi:hypothetical protein
VNPLRIRSASPIQRIASNGGPSSRSSSPAKTQGHVQVAHALETTHFYFQTHQGNQSNGIMELSTLSIKSSSDRLSRLTDPPKRLARCGGDSSRILFQHLYTFITHYPPWLPQDFHRSLLHNPCSAEHLFGVKVKRHGDHKRYSTIPILSPTLRLFWRARTVPRRYTFSLQFRFPCFNCFSQISVIHSLRHIAFAHDK